RPVRTYTVGFCDDEQYNETLEARDVAREYGTDHHEVFITQQEMLDFLPDLIFHQDEPIADPVCVPLYYVAKLARETGTTVVQVGEGSDELFCGYQDYVRYLNFYDRVWRPFSGLPPFVRHAAATTGGAALRIAAAALPAQVPKVGPDLLRRMGAGEEMFWSGAMTFDEVQKRRLLTREAAE